MKGILIISLSLLIMFVFSGSAVFAQLSEADAQKSIERKNYKQAKEIYLKLSQEKPENLAYILWAARLSAWIGDYKSALKIYDEVLQKNPANNEALLGKAYVMMWQKKYGKAKEVLATAEKNGRYDTAFLIAKINFFRYQNKFSEAREIVKIAKEVDAENIEIQELAKKIENAKTKTYQFTCEQSFEPFTSTTTACSANLNIQKGANNITIKAQSGKRFGQFYRKFGATLQRDLTGKLSVILNASIEPQKLVNLDTNFGANYQINKKLAIGVDYRFWRFNKENINIISTNLSYLLNDKTQVQSTFYKSSNNVLLLRFNRQVTKSLNVNLSYVKTFESKTANRLNFSQNALVVSGKYQINENLSLSGSYGFSQKESGPTKNIYGFGITFTK